MEQEGQEEVEAEGWPGEGQLPPWLRTDWGWPAPTDPLPVSGHDQWAWRDSLAERLRHRDRLPDREE